MTVIQRLIAERKARGLSVYKIAHLAGITAANIARTEKGQTSMGLNNLERWADALGYEVALVKKPDAEE